MKKTTLTLCLLLFVAFSNAQSYDLPKDIKLDSKEDYAKYEKDVIEATNWLIASPLSKETEKRKEVNAFLMVWLTGSPDVTIELNGEIVTFMDCGECLIIFMGGWAKYAIESKDYKDASKGNLAGIESVIEFYKKNKATIGKNKNIEKLIKLQDKKELADFIKSKL